MGRTTQARVATYIPHDLKEKLEEWAEEEERSMSWLMWKAIDSAVKQWEQQKQEQQRKAS